ncbi:MAG: secondary thiamine-phosphate synthase enzyme YjbQ [Gammaproteobacteria bacterium SHHR-1]|uniref:secondary thiamine-phosphate synthase enzyme YjbQ n=1 Tax=Magnetovirga frankeli TaxID=947516 RepID=UPI001292F231|nr:YjbQ family protein [gamma proteobacterium SS-5]
MIFQQGLVFDTSGRGSYNITQTVAKVVAESGLRRGLCQVFVQHTSASLMLCENADPTVRRDLEMILSRLAPDADPGYRHTLEGPDDMSAHIRSILTKMDLCLPVRDGHLALGGWQGIFLYEHRSQPQMRSLLVTLNGE